MTVASDASVDAVPRAEAIADHEPGASVVAANCTKYTPLA